LDRQDTDYERGPAPGEPTRLPIQVLGTWPWKGPDGLNPSTGTKLYT